MTLCGWLIAATVVVAILLASGVFIIIAGGLLFLPEYAEIIIPNVTSSHSVFKDQLSIANPPVVLLDEFTSENYSSFIVTSNITESEVSSKIRIARMINVASKSHQSENYIDLSDSYDIHFYALAGSTFNVTFPLLSGSDGTYVLVEFRNYVRNGSVLYSQRVMPSTDSQSVMFTLEMTGFVELLILGSNEVIGTFAYNYSIKEILPEEGEYVCTLNSITTTCQGTGVYDNNYILAQTTQENASISSIIVTAALVGKKKSFPIQINSNIIVLASVILAFSGIIVVISLTFIVAIVVFCCCFCSKSISSHKRQAQYACLNSDDT